MTDRMTRRGLLRRAPAVPFVIGAVVSQAPALVQRIGANVTIVGNRFASGPLPSAVPAEITLAERIRWFTQSLQWIEKPVEEMPLKQAIPVTVEDIQVVYRWESYLERLRLLAKNEGLSLEQAEEIVGHALR